MGFGLDGDRIEKIADDWPPSRESFTSGKTSAAGGVQLDSHIRVPKLFGRFFASC
jgi:hypothetical protein